MLGSTYPFESTFPGPGRCAHHALSIARFRAFLCRMASKFQECLTYVLSHECSNYFHPFDMTIADKTMGLPMTANSNGAVHVLNSASQVMREEQRDSRWTLKDLGQKLTVDAISAASAAALVAPIVTVIDKYACY